MKTFCPSALVRSGAIASVAALVLMTAAPLHGQNREHQQMAAEQRIMMERLQLLETANERTLAQLAQLAQAIKAVTDRIEASDAAMVKALADQKVVLDNLNVEMRVVRQNVQESGTRLQSIKEELQSVGSSVSSINVRSSSGIDTAASATTDPASAAGDVPAAPRSGVSPGRLYDTAWFDYTSGNYLVAITGFERLLSEYPKSDKADDAQYYIGMSYLKQKKMSEAISTFTAVINTYPTGDIVDEAYYYLGDAQRTLGQTEAARLSWQTVVSKYPNTDGALLARQRLDGLPPPAASAAPPRQP
jgi:tol-pal system protein YbgF